MSCLLPGRIHRRRKAVKEAAISGDVRGPVVCMLCCRKKNHAETVRSVMLRRRMLSMLSSRAIYGGMAVATPAYDAGICHTQTNWNTHRHTSSVCRHMYVVCRHMDAVCRHMDAVCGHTFHGCGHIESVFRMPAIVLGVMLPYASCMP